MPDSYFTDDAMVRRVHREWIVAFSGPRALLMQAAHPVAFAGFFAHTGALDAPYERLNRTARVLDAVIFGDRAQADRLTRRVRAMHRRVRGTLDRPAGRFGAGTPYAADDPALLLWIVASLVDSALLVYGKYVRPLSRDERDAYWREYMVVGRLFGLDERDMPATIDDLEAYVADMVAGPDLMVSDEVRELAVDIVMRPPVPLVARPVRELVNFITVGLLPDRLRRMYGFSWDPVRGLALESGAQYTRRMLVPLLPGCLRHVPRARAAA